MDAKETATDRPLELLPDIIKKPTFFNLITEFIILPDISRSHVLQQMQDNIPNEQENKFFHRRMIILSIMIQQFLQFIAKFLQKFGSKFEEFLNNGKKDKDSDGFISVMGKMDTRMELNKDIKNGDARYYPALSMMASKLVYENEFVIKTTVSNHWKMEFVKFYDCYNEFQKKKTTQAFIMREETEEDDKIVVSFRGTSLFSAYDWSTDFDYIWCKLGGTGKVHIGFLVALGLRKCIPEDEDGFGDYIGDFPKQINQDFNKPLAYYIIRDKLKEIMASNKRAKFIVTGHSLGGALAILFSALLAFHGEVELLDKLDGIYTYGQPRVGDKKFGEFMKTNLRKHNIKYYRIAYGYDIVPKLPLDCTLMTFKHFGSRIQFNSLYQGKLVEEEQQKPVNEKEVFLMKFLRFLSDSLMILMAIILARITAVWELIRGFIIGFTAGTYYTEGWFLIILRIFGILLPEFMNHNPQDYVNATMLASEDIFNYYHAMNNY